MDSSLNRIVDIPTLAENLRPSLNVLVICLSHSWGGLEQVAAHDALDVAALGLKVRVLVLRDTPIHQHLKDRKELEVIPLDFRPRNYLDFNLKRELHRLIDEGTNLIHTHQTSLLGSIVPAVWGRPNVALLASRHIMNNHSKRNFLHKAIYSRCDALVVMSETLRRNVLETHWIRDHHVKVINLGLDFDRFDPERVNPEAQRAAWGADSETIVIGLVGRIDPAKGQATFIRAAAGLLKNQRAGEKLKFVIVGEETLGSTGAYLDELKAMVAQFRLEDHVVFAGYQENVPEVMRGFDIFVMPSKQEAFGLVAIEAMAMECPIIISNSGSAEEIVGHNEFGLTVRPDDAFDLQKQLRFVLDRPMLRVQMGEKARQHVMKHYDRRRRILKTLELYEKSLRRRAKVGFSVKALAN